MTKVISGRVKCSGDEMEGLLRDSLSYKARFKLRP